MDGKLVKGWTQFNHSLNLPLLSAVIPGDWQKEFCLEYFDDVNYDSDASVIILSCMGYDIMHAVEIAEKFKKLGKIVIYGAHMDQYSEKLMSNVCDSSYHETPSPSYMKAILNDAINGTLKPDYLCGLNIDFPFDYSVLRGRNLRFVQMLTSIGCRNKCEYCCTAAVYKGRYRVRRIEYVIEDMRSVRKLTSYGSFIDSNIYNNPFYLQKLCKRIVDEKIGLMWGAQSTIDIGNDPETLKLLYQAGCRMLFIGLETLDQYNLEFVNKAYDVSYYKELVNKIHAAGIHVAGYFMLGFDSDTAESFKKIYGFINSTKITLPILNILMPVPGTGIYERFRREHRLIFENENDFDNKKPLYSVPCNHCFFLPRHMSQNELDKGFLNLYRMVSMNWYSLVKRSFSLNPLFYLIFLKMNLELRKEYKAMKKNVSF